MVVDGVNACGTFVQSTASSLSGPTVSAGGGTGAVNYTQVSQTPLFGYGRLLSPFTVDTVVSSAAGGVHDQPCRSSVHRSGSVRMITSNVIDTPCAHPFYIYRAGEILHNQVNSSQRVRSDRGHRRGVHLGKAGPVVQAPTR